MDNKELILKAYEAMDNAYAPYSNFKVGAALLADNKIYTGTEILSNTSINTSAEKNAILNMLNNGVSEIKKIVIINELGETIQPHEDSFEYFSLLNSLENVEVLINLEEEKVIKLTELFPSWWGTFRVKEK